VKFVKEMRGIKIVFLRIFKPNKQNRLFFVNFVFQTILGINREFPYLVHFTTKIASPQNITLEGGIKTITSFASSGNCYFSGYNGIKIGYNVLFAPGVKIISSNHDFTQKRSPIYSNPIEIGSNTWLGANVVILPNVVLGPECTVGAGSVVTKCFPDRSVIAGNPAKLLYRVCGCGGKLIQHMSSNKLICKQCGKLAE
jgi:acetyltransferase-like isoleucine patch superfamily enzyme